MCWGHYCHVVVKVQPHGCFDISISDISATKTMQVNGKSFVMLKALKNVNNVIHQKQWLPSEVSISFLWTLQTCTSQVRTAEGCPNPQLIQSTRDCLQTFTILDSI